mgnify:CR=1 FL=1
MSGMPRAYHAAMVTRYPLVHQGKVRDSFAIDAEHLLIVASDRLSAFDVVMAEPIPGKGEILTRISNFWFERTCDMIPNHLSGIALDEVIDDPQARAMGYFDALEHPAVGRFDSLGPPFRLEGVALGSRKTCSAVDADGEAVLREAGLDASEIAKLRQR